MHIYISYSHAHTLMQTFLTRRSFLILHGISFCFLPICTMHSHVLFYSWSDRISCHCSIHTALRLNFFRLEILGPCERVILSGLQLLNGWNLFYLFILLLSSHIYYIIYTPNIKLSWSWTYILYRAGQIFITLKKKSCYKNKRHARTYFLW